MVHGTTTIGLCMRGHNADALAGSWNGVTVQSSNRSNIGQVRLVSRAQTSSSVCFLDDGEPFQCFVSA